MNFVLIHDERDSVMIVNLDHVVRVNIGPSRDELTRVTMVDKTQFALRGDDAAFLISKMNMASRDVPNWLKESKPAEKKK